MSRSAKNAARELARIANQQGGYFTSKQAAKAGYGYRHLNYHENAGNFERIDHGLYRLPMVPRTEHDDLIRLTLWSRNQKGQAQAVASHVTALVLHELTEMLPIQTHLTVPFTFRKRVPRGCVLHKAMLESDEIEQRAGFRVTTPLRTIIDAATTGSVSQEQIEKAVKEALSRGLVTRASLVEAIRRYAPQLDRLKSVIRGGKILADGNRHGKKVQIGAGV